MKTIPSLNNSCDTAAIINDEAHHQITEVVVIRHIMIVVTSHGYGNGSSDDIRIMTALGQNQPSLVNMMTFYQWLPKSCLVSCIKPIVAIQKNVRNGLDQTQEVAFGRHEEWWFDQILYPHLNLIVNHHHLYFDSQPST